MANPNSNPLPPSLIHELSKVQWLEPWWCFCLDEPEFGRSFEEELLKELCDSHVLFPHRLIARAIAKREDCDDVLFWLPGADQLLAIVHLTWNCNRETDSKWPRTLLQDSLPDFVAREMVRSNREWSGN